MKRETADPIPSWNDRKAKQSIEAFVQRVTTGGGKDFVPLAERIAVFDNDGCLWPENPVPFQLAFVIDELKRRVPTEPKLAADPLVQGSETRHDKECTDLYHVTRQTPVASSWLAQRQPARRS
ncbi:MAG: hypothetical protein ACREX9_22695 [Gammaproteobacteria bacterium]